MSMSTSKYDGVGDPCGGVKNLSSWAMISSLDKSSEDDAWRGGIWIGTGDDEDEDTGDCVISRRG